MKKIITLSFIGVCAFSLSASAQALNEGFEGGAVPPSGWTAENSDNLKTFEIASVGKTGSKSAFIDVFNMDANGAEQGQTDALISPVMNLSTLTSPTLTFERAYQMYSDPATPYTPKDSLFVQISTDGVNWSPLFDKAGLNLITASTQFNASSGFVPTASEWASESVAIPAPYATSSTVQLKFNFMNDWENNFYLDDIKVTGSGSSVIEINLDAFVSVFPNPSNGNFNVDISANGLGQADIIVYNMVGEEVDRVSYNVLAPKNVKFNLANQPNGLYFVKVQTATGSATKKMVVNN